MQSFLSKIPLFANLSEDDLAQLCETVEEVRLSKGDLLFAQGSTGDKAYVVKDGEVEILKHSQGREVLLAVRKSGDVIGEMSLLQEAPRSATVKARTDSSLLAIRHENLDQMIDSNPSAARALLHTIVARLQSTEVMLRQSEKIAQLGTLTAGVAHELNNPAAAVQRGAEQLQNELLSLQEAEKSLGQLDLTSEQKEIIQSLSSEIQNRAKKPSDLDAITRSDLEMEFEDYLERQGIENAWEFASSIVNVGQTLESLSKLTDTFTKEQFPSIISWMVAYYDVYSLVFEVEQGSKQISQIVKALKSYVYLDQAPVQLIDLHEGIDNTLILLRNKLKGGITVHREYAQDLPRIQAYGSELNQVWTNIIDNACDALNGEGEITIRTRQEGNWVIVEIEDNGPGIPDEIKEKVFNPFFTTKEPGKGTGLGLDISYNIVVQKHRGDIRFTSRPGRTCFRVLLPIDVANSNIDSDPVPGIKQVSDETKKSILESARNIAVVGISTHAYLPANSVPFYLQQHGYTIFPIRSDVDQILGTPTFPSLEAITDPIDVVLICKQPDEILPIIEEAIRRNVKVVWMQEGIVNEAAAEFARQSGAMVIMDTNIRTEYERLMNQE
jgi:signal transduction histidine kinase/predicted CoA-binding protein